jgi:dienelactone hydrolase
VTVCLRFFIVLALISNVAVLAPRWARPTHNQPLLSARKEFVTIPNGITFHPDGKPLEPPPELYRAVRYPSAVGTLAAYLTPTPNDGVKRPGVIWAHGGYGGINDTWDLDNDQSPRPLVHSDFVLMCPSWRHENDNPGSFELFLGEVDDLLAAVKFMRTLPYVDQDRIYVVGYSVGGTLALLAAESTNIFRAAFCIGGTTDMARYFADGHGDGPVPFNPRDASEIAIRNPTAFIGSLQVPTFYFEGGNSWEAPAACKMELLAKRTQRPFHNVIVPGAHHWSVLQPALTLIANKIRLDTGPKCEIEISVNELRTVYRAMPQPQQVYD